MKILRSSNPFRLILKVFQMLRALDEDLTWNLQGLLHREELNEGFLLRLLSLHWTIQDHITFRITTLILPTLLEQFGTFKGIIDINLNDT